MTDLTRDGLDPCRKLAAPVYLMCTEEVVPHREERRAKVSATVRGIGGAALPSRASPAIGIALDICLAFEARANAGIALSELQ